MNQILQPSTASSSTWLNPSYALGVADGNEATNSSGTDLLILSQPGFTVPTGYEIVGFSLSMIAGTAKNPVSTTWTSSYQAEVSAATMPSNGKVTDVATGDETTYIGVVNSAGTISLDI